MRDKIWGNKRKIIISQEKLVKCLQNSEIKTAKKKKKKKGKKEVNV